MGAELFNADRSTDTAKLILAFRNVANAPKNKTTTVTIFCFLNMFKAKYLLRSSAEFRVNTLAKSLTSSLL